MSKIIKLIIWVIIIASIIFLGKALLGGTAQAPTSQEEMVKDEPAINANAQSSSDASLDQDMAGVDSEMNGLATDSATVDEGINAQ